MFGILAKFFRFSGRENGNKFKLSIVIGLIEALASAMKIPIDSNDPANAADGSEPLKLLLEEPFDAFFR